MKWPTGRARWMAAGAVVVLIVIASGLALRDPEVARIEQPDRVIGRGRLEPIGRVHIVSGPSEGGTVSVLRVEEGDQVARGDVLAVLDRYEGNNAAVLAAERDLQLAQLHRRQVSAGAKEADISAQQALVSGREAELTRSRAQFERANRLSSAGFVSVDTLEERALAVQRGQEVLKQARGSLRAMTETRPVDRDVASAQVALAEAQLAGARATRERSLIRAPIDGTVLSVYVRSGGTLGTQGLMSVGDIRQMIAVGEFDEQVATRIRPGQQVAVTLRGNGKAFRGRIVRILNDVNRSARTTSDVLVGRDARIAEAEIHFNPGQKVPRLVGAEAVVTVMP